MVTTRHKILDGLVQVYPRPNSPYWWCSASINGKQARASTGEADLALAKTAARNWYLRELGYYLSQEPQGDNGSTKDRLEGIGQFLSGDIKSVKPKKVKGILFRDAADQFTKEIMVLTEGERSPQYVSQKKLSLKVHILPFFGDWPVKEIIPGTIQDYRVHRMTSRLNKKTGEPMRPSRSTLHQEIVIIRQVLKTANRHGWLPYLPDFSTPYKASGKIGHRAWFSPEEWKRFYERTRERAKHPPKERWRKECEDFHDICLIMVSTGLRPDEAKRIEFRDVAIVTDHATGERILEIAVRGKRGTGWCKSMPGAVFPFQRLCERNNFQAQDRVFAKRLREQMNAVLGELGMKTDREGKPRSSYSFRHTYISMRLSEGADIYAIAKNCRTSVEMIEKHYAVHIKNVIDTTKTNVRREPAKLKPTKKPKIPK